MKPAPAVLLSDHVAARIGARLAHVLPGHDRVVLHPERVEGDPTAIEIAYFSGDLYPERVRQFALALREAGSLRWLHTFSAGVDHPWFQRLHEDGARITTSSGASAVPIAHTVLLYALALSRDLPGWLEAQRGRRWEPRSIHDLQGKAVGIFGMGPIGLEVARLAQAFRMQPIGLRRKPRGDEPCETWGWDRRDELLALADLLVLALPLSEETHHVIDARALALMKPDAILVNVGRGALVDEAALAASLAAGRLGGAGLDVFEQEPLPDESPLWRLPGVIVTPHSSGTNPGNYERASELFLENAALYARGESLRNELP